MSLFYIAYAVVNGDLARVAVNQSSREKAERDAKAHSNRHGESWLYAADRGQIMIGHYVRGLAVALTTPTQPLRLRQTLPCPTEQAGRTCNDPFCGRTYSHDE